MIEVTTLLRPPPTLLTPAMLLKVLRAYRQVPAPAPVSVPAERESGGGLTFGAGAGGDRFNMKKLIRAGVAALLAVSLLGACSAEGDIDTSGDGVKIEGDVDAKNP